jgi:hypothetical protein
MSTCESELIALADCAIELLFVLELLSFLGHPTKEAVTVYTDNKAAHDLCWRFSSAQHTRHIDRKLFKMRELRGAGVAQVKMVPTADNPADIFTKILDRQPFEKHRSTVLNQPALIERGDRENNNTEDTHSPKLRTASVEALKRIDEARAAKRGKSYDYRDAFLQGDGARTAKRGTDPPT